MARHFPHKTYRFAGIAIVAIMLIIGAIGIQFSRHYKRLIRARLPALSAKATDSLYDITVQDVRINIFTRTVTVYGMRMAVNLDVLARRRAQGRPPHVVLDVTVPRATVGGVRWKELDAERELDCRVVHFYKPEIRVQIMPEWAQHDTFRKLRPAAIQRVSAARIFIEEPRIEVRYDYGESAFWVQASGGEITATDWDFHPRQPFDTARFFAAKSAAITLHNVRYGRPGGHYAFSLGALNLNTMSRSAALSNLQIDPAVPYDTIYQATGHRTDIYDFSLPEAHIDSFDWKTLLVHHALHIGRISLREPQVSIYLSKRPPPITDSLRPVFPHQRFLQLSLPVMIDGLEFWDATIAYSETSGTTGATGTIRFNYLRGGIYNITNDSVCIVRNRHCWGLVGGKFMYRSNLGAMLDINLAGRHGDFSVRAGLRNLDASQIREPVSAMALADVASLTIRDAQMALRGNEDSTWGSYTVQYNALRVKLKKWDEEDSDLHSRVLLSFLANKLLLYRNNPMPGEAVRSVNTAVARGNTRSFFRTIWKNIFQGLAQTAIREEGALDIARRHVANKDRPRRHFFKGLVPKRHRIKRQR